MAHVITLLYWTCSTFCMSWTRSTVNVQPLELFVSIFYRLGTNKGMTLLMIFSSQSKRTGFVILPFAFPGPFKETN